MNPILVTGGAKGIGANICLALAEKGHDVIVHYKNSVDEAEEIVRKCRDLQVKAEKIEGDFSSIESTESFISSYLRRFEKTKGLVNNVGNYFLGSLADTTNEEWSSLIQTNLLAAVVITNALIPNICEEQGSIVNIGVSGLNRAKIKSPAYQVTKMGLWGYTLCLAAELASKLVNVNMVSPGFTENSVDQKPIHQLPMKRPATLREIAQAVVFLFEKESHYITGQNIEVAGGFGL